jgi:hypothetical protein
VKDVSDWFGAGRTIEELLALANGAPAISAMDTEDARPTIQLDDERWNICIRAAANVMRDMIYMRDSAPMLLRSIERGDGHTEGDGVEINGVRHGVGSLALIDATAARVRYQLDEQVRFEKKRKSDWIPTRCHSDIAGQVVANAVNLHFRPCAGIVHVPLLVGGEIITISGYHQPSGFVLDVVPLPPIPAHPTRHEAEEALARLLHPLRGFEGAANRSALAAAGLTAVLRPSLPTAPAILLDGNVQGVGKGLLARTLSVLATGRTPAVITEGHNTEETEKRIAAALLSGVPVVLLDNLQRHVASSALESAITEGMATIRVFGELTNLHVPCHALILLTANNATLRRDMLRRTLPVRIVVPHESPEQRQFDFDPVQEAQRDRAELLAAAFTVVRAWSHVRHLPEHQNQRRVLGSFDQWSQLVAGAVAWLTEQNPIDLIEARKAEDPYVNAERAVIDALFAQYGRAEFRAANAAQGIDEALWWEVLTQRKANETATPTANAVSYWLRSRRDRAFGSHLLTNRKDTTTNSSVWWLAPLAGDTGHTGDNRPPQILECREGNRFAERHSSDQEPGLNISDISGISGEYIADAERFE